MKKFLMAIVILIVVASMAHASPILPTTAVKVYQTYVGDSGSPSGYWYSTFRSIDTPALGAGYSALPDTTYLGWCVSKIVQNSPTSKKVMLYNTLGGGTGYNRIDDYQEAWSYINWMLNNVDPAGTGSGNSSTYQKTIWTLLYLFGYPDISPAQDFSGDITVAVMTFDVLSGGFGYIPQAGDKMAVLLANDCYQNTIIGVDSPPVPEPGTLLLLGVGLVGVCLVSVRHRRCSNSL